MPVYGIIIIPEYCLSRISLIPFIIFFITVLFFSNIVVVYRYHNLWYIWETIVGLQTFQLCFHPWTNYDTYDTGTTLSCEIKVVSLFRLFVLKMFYWLNVQVESFNCISVKDGFLKSSCPFPSLPTLTLSGPWSLHLAYETLNKF